MLTDAIKKVKVVDSHTGGEPTRIIIDGGPDLGPGSLAQRRERFRKDFDDFRSAVINEIRGSEVYAGGLLCEPVDPTCTTGVIFFNNVGYLGMCGSGTIGLMATLAYLKRIEPGEHRIETPVGIVDVRLHESGDVSFRNVASYRTQKDVEIKIEGFGAIAGDVAWGGNWFFLVNEHGRELSIDNIEELTGFCWKIRKVLQRSAITGDNGQEIDHIELYAPPTSAAADSKNFVLCPGKAYDRSPCGTGTSAKMTCLYGDGKLKPRQIWRQESILGSIFEGSIEVIDGRIYPSIKGSAYVNAEATLILDSRDPFCMGIRK